MGGFRRRLRAGLALAAAIVLPACAAAPPPVAFRLVPASGDAPGAASEKIQAWQARERREGPAPAVLPEGRLGASFEAFVSAQRRAQAEAVRAWVQAEAERSYRSDAGFDRWPTFRELLESGGDDCDGLELLTLHALRALGFPEDSLFRAVIERRADGLQHMVTLWLETPEQPLVIDPTGFATGPLVPLAALPAWQPRAVFNEHVQHGVAPRMLAPAGAPE